MNKTSIICRTEQQKERITSFKMRGDSHGSEFLIRPYNGITYTIYLFTESITKQNQLRYLK